MADNDQEITDGDLKFMQAEVIALAEAWLDRGYPPEAVAGVLSAQGNLWMLEVGTKLGPLIKTVVDLWVLHKGAM